MPPMNLEIAIAPPVQQPTTCERMPWPTRALHPPGEWAQPISRFMRSPPTSSWSSLTAFVLLLAAGGRSNWSAEGQVKATVDKYARAVRAEDTDTTARSCAPDMTWTYYVAPAKTSVLQGAAASAGFVESIRKIQGRDGFDIDITSVTVAGPTATVQVRLEFGRYAPIFARRAWSSDTSTWRVVSPLSAAMAAAMPAAWPISAHLMLAADRHRRLPDFTYVLHPDDIVSGISE